MVTLNGLVIDENLYRVTVDDRDVRLTPTEFGILYLLMENRGMIFSYDEIYERVWKMEPVGAENIVSVHMSHLRKKIEKDPANFQYIRMHRGRGYSVG